MFKRLFSSQLRINMLSGTATTVINIIVMAVGYPIYLHFLGYEKYGVWLVLTTVLSFAALGNLGIGTAVMKLVAEEYGRNDILGVQRYITTAIAVLFISGMIILASILIFRNPIVSAFKLDEANRQMVLWLLPYIGILCIYTFIIQIFEASLAGLERMDLANYIRTFSHATQVIVSGMLLALGLGVKSMLIGSFASCAIIHALTIICIGRIVNLHLWNIGNINRIYLKRLFQFGGTIFAGSLISMLFTPFNKLMLARYAGVATLPVYEIAYTASMRVRGLVESGLRALLPKISSLGANLNQQTSNKILEIYRRSMKFIFIFGAPFYAVLLLLSPFLLQIWLGERFVETLTSAFQVMLIGTFLSLLGVPAYYTLMGINKVVYCFISHLIQSAFNFILVIAIVIFIHTMQVQQVVFAVAFGMSISSFYLIRKLRIILVKNNEIYRH